MSGDSTQMGDNDETSVSEARVKATSHHNARSEVPTSSTDVREAERSSTKDQDQQTRIDTSTLTTTTTTPEAVAMGDHSKIQTAESQKISLTPAHQAEVAN